MNSFDAFDSAEDSMFTTMLTGLPHASDATPGDEILLPWVASAIVPAAPSVDTALVPRAPAHEFLGHDGVWLKSSEMKSVTGSTGATNVGPLDRPSMLNALAFKCRSSECPDGQCSRKLDELNVFHLRQKWSVDCAAFGYDGSCKEPLFKSMESFYDRHRKKFRKPSVRITSRSGLQKDVDLCIATWAICVANAGWSTFEKARADVTQNRELKSAAAPKDSTKLLLPAKRLQMAIDDAGAADEASCSSGKTATFFRLVKSYVKELATTLEHAPVPGAQRRTIEYVAPRETWEKRAEDCEKHFADHGHHVVVDRRLLKKAWQSLGSLVDKTMKAHAKCDACAYFDAQLASLVGRPDEDAVELRKALRTASRVHRQLMAVERAELDDAGYRSF